MVAPTHDRMPVILAPSDFDAWLDVSGTADSAVRSLSCPCPDSVLTTYEVISPVNNARNDHAACCEPLST
ncbi:MAG: hypothetical protein GY894_05100 [Planctomycetes bacterium]|nr:hypothetical protein [Planctomycetota bacterium]MCP4838724.1 hypothetical protein [Planctomycetota bacterium]